MSREIKFRAWQDNKMVFSPLSSNYGLTRFFGFLYEDAPIMQYTGLKDKNGKEIYEGDKIKQRFYLIPDDYNDIIAIVEYNNNDCCFYAVDYENQQMYSMSMFGSSCEIVGNIHA